MLSVSSRRVIGVDDLIIGVFLGSGANSAVYDGFIFSTGQRVAIKVQKDEAKTSNKKNKTKKYIGPL